MAICPVCSGMESLLDVNEQNEMAKRMDECEMGISVSDENYNIRMQWCIQGGGN